MPSPHLFLNELSCRSSMDRDGINDAMSAFVALVQAAVRVRPETALVTERRFADLDLADGISVRQWGGRGRAREQFRYLQNRRQKKSPFTAVLADGVTDLVEYTADGERAAALGAAHLYGGLPVSLPVSPRWGSHTVQVQREMIVETAGGPLTSCTDTVDLRHASSEAHVHHHTAWLKEAGVGQIADGAQVWRERADLFPGLVFLPRVCSDLESLDPSWLAPVLTRLRELDSAAREWAPKESPAPVYRSKATPEAENRKRFCHCTDADGQTRLFDWHLRFTPGKGRLHFRADAASGLVHVAYIGPKIEGPIEG